MIKKITTFIHPYIIRLCSIGMLLAMSTLHATSLKSDKGDIYRDEGDNKHIFREKLTMLPQQVHACNTLTDDETAVLHKLLLQAPNNNVQRYNDTIIPYETADVFKKAATFVAQGDIWARKDLSALEKEFISCLIMLQTEEVQNELGDDLLLYYEAISKENVSIATFLKKMQIKAILAPLPLEEQTLLATLLQENFMNADKLPHQAVALLSAVDDYMTCEYDYDFTCIDECIATLEASKEALLPLLIEAKKFFTGKIKELRSGKTKVVNSLLQLICLQGGADAAFTTFISSHLEGYELHIEQVNRIVDENLPTAEKELAQKESAIAQAQQTLAQLLREKTSITTEKELIQTFLAQIATQEYLQMKMAYFIALLTECTGREEALAEAIDTLKCAFKKRLERLNQKYVTIGEPISPFFIDKVVNALLCYLVDTQARDKQVKEMASIQALYTAQFRFNLLETLEKSLQNKPQLKNWLDTLNKSGEAIVIEEIITEEVAETLMTLDTFMQNSAIGLEKKQQVITEALQSLKEVIFLTCTDRFNAIRQQLMEKSIKELPQQLQQHICLVTITSFIKDKGQRMKQGKQDISAIYTQQVKHIKECWSSFASSRDKQAAIKQLLQRIQAMLSQQIGQVTTQVNNQCLQKSTENQANAISIGAEVYNPTANGHDLTKLAEWTEWFNKLQRNIQAQAANVLPLLGLLLLILLEYCELP